MVLGGPEAPSPTADSYQDRVAGRCEPSLSGDFSLAHPGAEGKEALLTLRALLLRPF